MRNSIGTTQRGFHLAVVFTDATPAAANGMWSEVHPNDFFVLIIMVMCCHHTLLY
jgi:hypothetical protein